MPLRSLSFFIQTFEFLNSHARVIYCIDVRKRVDIDIERAQFMQETPSLVFIETQLCISFCFVFPREGCSTCSLKSFILRFSSNRFLMPIIILDNHYLLVITWWTLEKINTSEKENLLF